GPNGLQNFPVISAAERVAGGLSVSGTLDVGPSQGGSYRIALYASASCDPSGFGEGERFLGSFNRSISNAAQSFQTNPFATSDPLPPGTFITATATSPGLATSEFSQCFPLDPVPWVVNSANDVADGLCNAAHCSLRDAIIAANSASNPRPQSIHFNIPTPVTGEILIAPVSSLPTITRTMAIYGYTQPGSSANTDPVVSNAQIRIRIHGTPFGLSICADGTSVRGLAITGTSQSAIIVGGTDAGQLCSPGDDSTIIGNFIGLRADGTTEGVNSRGVTVLGARVRLGGTAPADRNVIAAANDSGVFLINSGIDGSEVLGNLIGTDRSGTLDRGNETGVTVADAVGGNRVRIGGTNAPNRMRFNDQGLVLLVGQADRVVDIGENSLRDNGDHGIDLGNDGPTANDLNDADAGPNGLQNFPVLTRAVRTANGLSVSGILDVKVGTSNAPYRIDVYASDSCDASGHGEGEVHIGSTSVNLTQTTAEFFDFELTTDADLVATDRITATATSSEGTSEFSACLTASDLPPGIVVNTDADPVTPTTVGCDLVECTLREAITLANLQQGTDLIRFAIPDNLAPFDILLGTPLPVILEGLTIDGYTQPGASPNASAGAFDAVLKVNLRGFNSLQNLLRVCAPDPVTIRGLAFTSAAGPALVSGTNDGGNCNTAGFLVVQGNQFGIAPSGARFSNGAGILADKTLASIGGVNPADRNLISNSTTYGVRIASSSSNGSNVLGNVFGRDLNDSFDDANARDIEVSDASDVGIGSTSNPARANRFYGSAQAVVVLGTVSRRVIALGNAHTRHSGATAIDLAPGSAADGITANDTNDADSGPNELQNSPVLTGGSAGAGTITVNGTLDVPGGIATPVNYRLAFYESTSCNDQSGIGNGREGEVYLGSFVRPFSSNAESFSVELPLAPPTGSTFITALVLAPDANMSEFSNCLQTPRPDALHANGFE
ncbi:MAG TPA: CSLREA domain-containing protein, partial [Xanthomonadales bacterium]|nr:CSLREA domain-containing protein [Xanthomonadales bacterium]